MQAVTIDDGTIRVADRPDPAPGPDELLVRVAGAGLNGADLLQRAGRYPAPAGIPDDQPGLEFAGTVTAVGDRVVDHAPGDRVMGIVGGAAQAELVTTPADLVLGVPDGWDLVSALREQGVAAGHVLGTLAARDAYTVPVAAIHDLGDAATAYDDFDRGGHLGKVILAP
jgi:hypothetical protein